MFVLESFEQRVMITGHIGTSEIATSLRTTELDLRSHPGRVCYQWGLPRLVLHLGRVGVTIISLSGRNVVTTRPAVYKKKPPYMFEMNKIMLRPNLDISRGIFGLSGRNKN